MLSRGTSAPFDRLPDRTSTSAAIAFFNRLLDFKKKRRNTVVHGRFRPCHRKFPPPNVALGPRGRGRYAPRQCSQTFFHMTAADYDDVIAFWAKTTWHRTERADRAICEGITDVFAPQSGNELDRAAGGEVVATTCCAATTGGRGVLYHLAVAAGHRKQGIARAMVNCCIEETCAVTASRAMQRVRLCRQFGGAEFLAGHGLQ